MAVYPSHKSVLVIEPIGLTNEDIELLDMEENPLQVLQYFVSMTESSTKFKSNIYEDDIANYEFEQQDLIDNGVVCYREGNKFLFLHLLQNTAWAANQFNVSNETISNYIDKGLINGIKSRNKKYNLVIPDQKFQIFLSNQTRSDMSSSSVGIPKRTGMHHKVMSVLKSGVVGGLGDRVNSEELMPHMAKAYPNETFTRAQINSALHTLMGHGDLVRVPIVDSNGNPTDRFATGKYTINIRTAVNHPAANHPIVANPVVPNPVVPSPVVNHPVNPPAIEQKDSLLLAATSQEKHKLPPRIALEDYLRKNLKDGIVAFTAADVAKAYPQVSQRKITQALNNVKRGAVGQQLLNDLGRGKWEYRNSPDIPWTNSKDSPSTIEDIVKQMASMQANLVELLKKKV